MKDDPDDDSMSDYWRDVKAAQQEKRASNRRSSAQMLTAAGVNFESKNIDAHLIVKMPGKTIDFWPGTGLWMVRGQPTRRYGVRGHAKAAGFKVPRSHELAMT